MPSRSSTVRIGTEAFARPTEWFGLEDCEITSRGLSTPAVQRLIHARSAPPVPKWTPGKKQDSAQDTRAQELIRKLLYARRTDSIALAESVCNEATSLTWVSPRVQEKMDAAVRSGRLWAEKQIADRQQLFASLERAVADQHHGKVRRLLQLAKAATKDDSSESVNHVITAATDYLTTVATARKKHLNTLLDDLDGSPQYMDPDLFYAKVLELLHAARTVDAISPQRRAQVEAWRKRSGVPAGPDQGCPRCGAGNWLPCLVDTTADEVQGVPHDERMRPIIEERKERQRA
ncbi:hypothetical protein [Streptomyces sp. NPDC056987]|uniref:hypothetical protein n=1 Tax=Streptomyces sp. NPDC056987 TaxID=3345988 RepID=UPI00363CA080